MLTACGISTDEFIRYTVDGGPEFVFVSTDSMDQDNLSNGSMSNIWGVTWPNTDHNISFHFDYGNIALGSSQQLLHFFATPFSSQGISVIPTPVPVHITELGNVGEFITGNFAGNVMMDNQQGVQNTYAITCSFRVRRTF